MTELIMAGSALAIGMPGTTEIIIVLAVVLLIFGGKKLPELARGLARGLRTFKDEMMGIKTDIDQTETPEKDDSQTPDASEPTKSEDQQ